MYLYLVNVESRVGALLNGQGCRHLFGTPTFVMTSMRMFIALYLTCCKDKCPLYARPLSEGLSMYPSSMESSEVYSPHFPSTHHVFNVMLLHLPENISPNKFRSDIFSNPKTSQSPCWGEGERGLSDQRGMWPPCSLASNIQTPHTPWPSRLKAVLSEHPEQILSGSMQPTSLSYGAPALKLFHTNCASSPQILLMVPAAGLVLRFFLLGSTAVSSLVSDVHCNAENRKSQHKLQQQQQRQYQRLLAEIEIEKRPQLRLHLWQAPSCLQQPGSIPTSANLPVARRRKISVHERCSTSLLIICTNVWM